MNQMEENTCACGGSCGCGGSHAETQVYLTKEQYIARLEEYLVQLRAEIVSVEEELAELCQPA
jgi:hypothetical protein